jgi:hypothetical protein
MPDSHKRFVTPDREFERQFGDKLIEKLQAAAAKI